jgi:hypothetical protein
MILHVFNLIGARWGVAAAWRTLVAWFPLGALLLGATAGAWGGWVMGRAPLHVALSQLRTERATQAAADVEAAYKRFQDAQARGHALIARLDATRTQNNRLSQEKTRAFQNQSTGRACLSLDALRLLNDAPGLSVAGLPATTSSAATASEPVATDTDLGTWAIAAGAQYQACSHQLSALIDWHGPPAPPAQPTPNPSRNPSPQVPHAN